MGFFNQIGEFFQEVGAFFGRIPGEIKKYASRSLELTRAIYDALNSPAANVLTAIIPGTWDEELREKIIQLLGKILPYLQIVDSCKDETHPVRMLECWIEQLRQLPEHAQKAMLMKLASLLTAHQDGAELKQRLYDMYTQATYTHQKPPKQ